MRVRTRDIFDMAPCEASIDRDEDGFWVVSKTRVRNYPHAKHPWVQRLQTQSVSSEGILHEDDPSTWSSGLVFMNPEMEYDEYVD